MQDNNHGHSYMNTHLNVNCLLVIFLLNISSIWTMDRKRQRTIRIQISYTVAGSHSLESYYERQEKLKQIAYSCENVEKVNASICGFDIDMVIKQKALKKQQSKEGTQHLVGELEKGMLPEIIQAHIISKKRNK